jgi:hypothetical protein
MTTPRIALAPVLSLALALAACACSRGDGDEVGAPSDDQAAGAPEPAADPEPTPAAADEPAADPVASADEPAADPVAADEPAADEQAEPVVATPVAGKPSADEPAAGPRPNQGPPQNLTVLKKSLSRKQVTELMKKEFGKGLGVKCAFCHDVSDYAADDSDKKEIARKMFRMQEALNKQHFGGKPKVTCFTCHQGKEQP